MAQAYAGSEFVGWDAGCEAVSENTCTVTMDAAKWVTATFAQQAVHAHREQERHRERHRDLNVESAERHAD